MIFSVHRHPTYFLRSLTEWVQRFCAQVDRGESVNYFAYLFPGAIVFFLKNRLSFLGNCEKRGNASDSVARSSLILTRFPFYFNRIISCRISDWDLPTIVPFVLITIRLSCSLLYPGRIPILMHIHPLAVFVYRNPKV